MKIYTKTGDSGETSLLGGTRVSKSHLRIEAYGTIDELNSHMGLLGDQAVNSSRKDLIKTIQDRLFTIGSHLATDPSKSNVKKPDLKESDIETLETEMDEMTTELPELKNFILPGGHQGISFCHIARCVCRRAERAVIRLSVEESVDRNLLKYLNRLSDFLFVLARRMAYELEVEEVLWEPRK